MASIQLRNIPDDLYREIATIAKNENRSIPQQTIRMLRMSTLDLKLHRQQRSEIVDKMKKKTWPTINFDFVKEIRKDRNER